MAKSADKAYGAESRGASTMRGRKMKAAAGGPKRRSVKAAAKLKIVIEGPQGSGKTFVGGAIVAFLRKAGYVVSAEDAGEEMLPISSVRRPPHSGYNGNGQIRVETRQEMSGDEEMREVLAQNFHALKDDLDALLRRRAKGL